MPVRVETVQKAEDAARIVSTNRTARYFGGGTLLMRAVNDGDQSFDTLVVANDASLRDIRTEGDRIVLGAGVTMAQIMHTRDAAHLQPVARTVGGPAVRSVATIGGNLFAPPPYGDFATALLALGADVVFADQPGSAVSMDDFLRDRARHANRVVTSISVPRLRDVASLRFRKVTRIKPKGAAVITVAILMPGALPQQRSPRIAYGNMGPVPLRALAAERALESARLDEAGLQSVLRSATDGIPPHTDALASAWYRQEVVPVHLKRALLGAA